MSSTNASTLRVLHLEDNPNDRSLVREMLESDGLSLALEYAGTRVEFETALRATAYDLIISDFTLPSYDGQAALAQAQRLQPDAAFIFFSGTIGEEIAVESLKTGATDYVLKQRPKRLVSAVRRALEETQERRRREAAEAALRQSEERFRIVARATHDVIWELNVKTNELWHNENFEIVFGYTTEPIKSFTSYAELIHEEDRHRVMSSLSALMAGGGRVWWSEYRVRRASGEFAYVYDRGYVLFDHAGKPQRMIGVLIDVTERRQAEVKIREQAALLEKAHDAIIVCDLEDRVQFWNPSAERIYGWSAEEAIGRTLEELLYREVSPELEQARQSFKERGEWRGDLRQSDRHGRPVFVQSSWTLVRDEAGQPKSKLVISTDVTATRQLEEQLHRAQRLESLAVLVGGIAHDLNNALAPVLMGASVLEMMDLPPGSGEIIGTIKSSANRGADMVKQVLTFARGESGAMSEVRVNELVTEICRMINDTFPKIIRCEVQLADDLWPVKGAATQIHQVLLNLCVNARDAMEQGGKLTISARNVSFSAEDAPAHQVKSGDYVCVAVADTGTGIPPEMLQDIFKPFFSTKAPGRGTGLGLPTVQTIVRNHGGTLTVQSQVGQGTEFKVFLPAFERAQPTQTTRPLLLPAGNREGVLVVDDEAAVLAVVKASLENYDYRVHTANSGREAIAFLSENADKIQLVITDLAMPEMDGIATIKALRNIKPDVKIIAASGLDWSGERGDEVRELAQGFLQKPFTVEKLLLATRNIFTASQ